MAGQDLFSRKRDKYFVYKTMQRYGGKNLENLKRPREKKDYKHWFTMGGSSILFYRNAYIDHGV